MLLRSSLFISAVTILAWMCVDQAISVNVPGKHFGAGNFGADRIGSGTFEGDTFGGDKTPATKLADPATSQNEKKTATVVSSEAVQEVSPSPQSSTVKSETKPSGQNVFEGDVFGSASKDTTKVGAPRVGSGSDKNFFEGDTFNRRSADNFGGDRYGGDGWGRNNFGGDRFGGGRGRDNFGGDRFGKRTANNFGGDRYGGDGDGSNFGGDRFGGDGDGSNFGGDRFGK